MSTDAIVILNDEHVEIRRAFRDFEKTHDTETARKGELAEVIVGLLTSHTYSENDVMYPRGVSWCQSSSRRCSSPTRSIMSPMYWCRSSTA
jgi:hypothetical protein